MTVKVAVIGLGYVGLNMAVALGKSMPVAAFDILEHRVNQLKQGLDEHHNISEEDLKAADIQYHTTLEGIKSCNVFIIAVPTPAYFYELPNIDPLLEASREVGQILKKGDIVIYESTVYPGTTEDVCIPLLEQISALKNLQDFTVAYSPERISPGDSNHHLSTIKKLLSAQDKKTLEIVKSLYETICDEVVPVSSIKVAESSKLLENTQRDVNIALMNEFADIMHHLNIDTHEVIEAAATKWNFSKYRPGLVGGHCISVDPYYLAFQAKRHGVDPDLILTARKVNNNAPRQIIFQLTKMVADLGMSLKETRLGVLGMTYKENVADIRNSLAIKMSIDLSEMVKQCLVHDPLINKQLLSTEYRLNVVDFDEMKDLDIVILAVGHDFYKARGLPALLSQFNQAKIFMDIPGLFYQQKQDVKNTQYWSL